MLITPISFIGVASITTFSCAPRSLRRAQLLFLVAVSTRKHADLSAILHPPRFTYAPTWIWESE